MQWKNWTITLNFYVCLKSNKITIKIDNKPQIFLIKNDSLVKYKYFTCYNNFSSIFIEV